MKKLAIIAAVVLGVSFGAFADNIESAAKTKVNITSNGFNLIQVATTEDLTDVVVKIYSSDFELINTTRMDGKKSFNIGKLSPGSYIVKVEKSGVEIYTEVVRKVK